MSENRWKLSERLKNFYTPIIKNFIEKVEATNELDEDFSEDLSDMGLNPQTLIELLENLGYEQNSFETNGWECDFRIEMFKEGFKSLIISGCGLIFELTLSAKENM